MGDWSVGLQSFKLSMLVSVKYPLYKVMLSLKVAELVSKQKFTVVTVFLYELFIEVQNV